MRKQTCVSVSKERGTRLIQVNIFCTLLLFCAGKIGFGCLKSLCGHQGAEKRTQVKETLVASNSTFPGVVQMTQSKSPMFETIFVKMTSLKAFTEPFGK